MRFSHLLLFTAVLNMVFGAAAIIAPMFLGALYGGETSVTGLLWARYYGSAIFCLGLFALWFRALKTVETQRVVAFIFLVLYLVNLIISLHAQVAGYVNVLGWSTIVLQLLLIIGYGWWFRKFSS